MPILTVSAGLPGQLGRIRRRRVFELALVLGLSLLIHGLGWQYRHWLEPVRTVRSPTPKTIEVILTKPPPVVKPPEPEPPAPQSAAALPKASPEAAVKPSSKRAALPKRSESVAKDSAKPKMTPTPVDKPAPREVARKPAKPPVTMVRNELRPQYERKIVAPAAAEASSAETKRPQRPRPRPIEEPDPNIPTLQSQPEPVMESPAPRSSPRRQVPTSHEKPEAAPRPALDLDPRFAPDPGNGAPEALRSAADERAASGGRRSSAAPDTQSEGGQKSGTGSMAGGRVAGEGGGNSAATPIFKPKPDYPPAARRRQLEGRVVLRVEVLADGECGQVEILQSSGHDILDQAAVETVKTWHFRPGRKDGVAVKSWLKQPFDFHLEQ